MSRTKSKRFMGLPSFWLAPRQAQAKIKRATVQACYSWNLVSSQSFSPSLQAIRNCTPLGTAQCRTSVNVWLGDTRLLVLCDWLVYQILLVLFPVARQTADHLAQAHSFGLQGVRALVMEAMAWASMHLVVLLYTAIAPRFSLQLSLSAS